VCKWNGFVFLRECIVTNFHPRSCIVDGRVGPLHKVFSSTSQWAVIEFKVKVWTLVARHAASYSLNQSQFEFDESWHCDLGIQNAFTVREELLL